MSWDRIEGQWKQRRGSAEHLWAKMISDDVAAIGGDHEEIVTRLQIKFGIAKEEAERQADEFRRLVLQLKESADIMIEACVLTKEKITSTKMPMQSNAPSRDRLKVIRQREENGKSNEDVGHGVSVSVGSRCNVSRMA